MAKLRLRFPSVKFPSVVTVGKGSIRELYSYPVEETAIIVTPNSEVHKYVNISSWCDAGRAYICRAGREPDKETIEELSGFYMEKVPETVIALGGGSVLDLARLAWDRIKRETIGKWNLPKWILVPTIHGSGAEATTTAVYFESGKKIAKVDADFLARQVILDGNFLRSITHDRLEIQSCDILAHAIEAYLSILQGYLTEEFSISAIRTLYRIGREGDMSSADPDLVFKASFFAGLAAGNRSTGMVHAFAHSVAALGVPHAAGVGLALGPALRFLREKGMLKPELLEVADIPSFEDFFYFIDKKTKLLLKSTGYGSDVRQCLSDRAERKAIIGRVSTDVCMRTNCCRLSGDEIERYLDYIYDGISIQD